MPSLPSWPSPGKWMGSREHERSNRQPALRIRALHAAWRCSIALAFWRQPGQMSSTHNLEAGTVNLLAITGICLLIALAVWAIWICLYAYMMGLVIGGAAKQANELHSRKQEGEAACSSDKP